jgi:hypothetical protein
MQNPLRLIRIGVLVEISNIIFFSKMYFLCITILDRKELFTLLCYMYAMRSMSYIEILQRYCNVIAYQAITKCLLDKLIIQTSETWTKNFCLLMPDAMICFEMTDDILSAEKRGNYFDYADVDPVIDFSLKECASNIGAVNISKNKCSDRYVIN